MQPISFEVICFDHKEREIERNVTDTKNGDADHCHFILASRTYDQNYIKIATFSNNTEWETEMDFLGIHLNRFHKVIIKDFHEEVKYNLALFVTIRYYKTK